MNEFAYALLSVFVVSIISLIGIISIPFKPDKLKSIVIYFISFSAGALLGDSFIHLLPNSIEKFGFTSQMALYIIFGILIFFILEKIVHWQHCHMPITKNHVHSFAYISLIGDGLHNFIDGLVIAASYMISLPVGLATTLAVIIHEIPQEIGNFGILIHGGFSKAKALILNFASALLAVLGAIFAFILGEVANLEEFIVPLTIGGFIYIAASDLIPELHKEVAISKSIIQILCFILGVIIMLSMLLLE